MAKRMWCQQCQQEVPAIHQGPAALACPRCQMPFHAKCSTGKPAPAVVSVVKESGTSPDEVDRRLREMARLLKRPLVGGGASLQGDIRWVDGPHTLPGSAKAPTPATRRAYRSRSQGGQWIAWLATSLGGGLALGGAILLGYALVGNHPDFWQWGVGVTLVGQVLLVAGLVWVLTSLWGASRAAVARLAACEEELAHVHRSAQAILAQRPGSASAFYADLARGSNPTLLMANLKGQIDRLAAHLHHDVN